MKTTTESRKNNNYHHDCNDNGGAVYRIENFSREKARLIFKLLRDSARTKSRERERDRKEKEGTTAKGTF